MIKSDYFLILEGTQLEVFINQVFQQFAKYFNRKSVTTVNME